MPASEVGTGRTRTSTASLGHLLGRVGHRVNRQITRALRGGPTLEQWRVIALLSDGRGRPMSEIAGHAMVPAPTLTKIVDRLVESALVYRRADESDRRRVLVFLSDHGRELYDELAADVERAENDIVDELDQAERAQLVRLLGRLTD